MSFLETLRAKWPPTREDGTTTDYLKRLIPLIEEESGCKIQIFYNKNGEYGKGWSYTIERRGSSESKYGNGREERNLLSAIESAVKPQKAIHLSFHHKK